MERLIERPSFVVKYRKITNIKERTTVKEIPGFAEKQFFLLITEQGTNSGMRIKYEPHTFTVVYENDFKESTAPDFLIETLDGVRYYIEITTRELNGKDPKRKQKRIMSHFPEIDYRVLYRADLREIQKDNPQYSFWHSKRIRK